MPIDGRGPWRGYLSGTYPETPSRPCAPLSLPSRREGGEEVTDWSGITIQEFDATASTHNASQAVSLGVLDRLPFKFESKEQYLCWRDTLAEGFELDGRDVALVGSAATGRSLSARKRFKTFHGNSDVDIAVVSGHHFDIAWRWFRLTNPNFLTGLDRDGKKLFDAHRTHHVFEGVIAADYFLSYLPFGRDWSLAMQRTQQLLPQELRGRLMKVRIYKDFFALRERQAEAMTTYQRYLANKLENKAGSDGE